ncbi:hypothetical protein BVX94_02315 [bacterium B17]|nr:hypothetical protein BVX94_02315 [bacterium B17]
MARFVPEKQITLDWFLSGIESIKDRISNMGSRLRQFYYQVMLLNKVCPKCKSATSLNMLKDGACICQRCEHQFDPTLTFQSCPQCQGRLSKQLFHYWCNKCKKRVRSLYCFDVKVFDASYFREMMRESRERKQQKIATIKKILQSSRSKPLTFNDAPALEDIPGLDNALDLFSNTPIAQDICDEVGGCPHFDMAQYRKYILDITDGCIIHFDGITNMISDQRLDRIFRFITIVFMQHNGEVTIEQEPDGEIILRGK